jgi:hypothetical protein
MNGRMVRKRVVFRPGLREKRLESHKDLHEFTKNHKKRSFMQIRRLFHGGFLGSAREPERVGALRSELPAFAVLAIQVFVGSGIVRDSHVLTVELDLLARAERDRSQVHRVRYARRVEEAAGRGVAALTCFDPPRVTLASPAASRRGLVQRQGLVLSLLAANSKRSAQPVG